MEVFYEESNIIESEMTTPETTVPETTAPPTLPPDPIQEMVGGMSLEEKVGQLFLARCPVSNGIADIEKYHLGGYILFGVNFEGQNPESIREMLGSFQAASEIPMLVAVDEEGGMVTRVSSTRGFRGEKFASPRSLYQRGGMELVLSTESEKAMLLHDLGINVNMAPVCDVTGNPSAFMYQRSLGSDPEIVGEFASGAVARMKENGVGAVLKHFPGYGNNADTHTGIARDSRTYEQLEQCDILPFMAAIDGGAEAILVSHTIVEAFDSETPASLSPIVHDYIRLALAFNGVIITDDLVMEAITKQYGTGESAVLAVLAGNDLLCASEYAVQYQAVLEAAQEGRIPVEQIDRAVTHILQWKQSLGLFPESSG